MPAHAVQPDEILPDAKLEERARNLSRELRCMVCQNQSIDDSDAPLARDLRLLVRERLKAGDSDKQVLDFLTTRYGDFVLLNPPMNAKTFLLWVLPAGLPAASCWCWRCGGAAVLRQLRLRLLR
jgi:cytochrome c-type biogenesis protein CcmH